MLATDYKVASISRKVAAVGAPPHGGYDSPTTSEAVKLTMAGIRQLWLQAEASPSPGRLDLKRIVNALPKDPLGDATVLCC